MKRTIRLSPATYQATLRDLGYLWTGGYPAFNYRVKRTALLQYLWDLLATVEAR